MQGICLRFFKLLVLMIVMIFIVGLSPGYAGLQPVLLKAGVYNGLCNHSKLGNSTSCEAQITQLAFVASTSLTVLNAFAFFAGAFNDFLGNCEGGLIGVAIWCAAQSITGLYPREGFIFFVGYLVSSIASTTIFIAMLAHYSNGLAPKRFPTLVHALLTGGWDLGSISYVIFKHVYFALNFPPLWICFLVYGLGFGIPVIIFFLIVYPPRFIARTCTCTQDIIVPSNTLSWNEFLNQIKELGKVLKTRIYWIFVLNALCVITYGYFWIPLVIQHMRWHGADIETANHYNDIFAILLSVVGGVSAFLLGFVINFRNKITLCFVLACQFLIVGLLGVTSSISGPLWIQYISFVLLILWRVNAFVIGNSILGVIYPSYTVVGKAIGFLYSLAGLIGFFADKYLALLIISDPWWFFPIHITSCSVGAFVSILLIILTMTDLDDDCVSISWKQLDYKML